MKRQTIYAAVGVTVLALGGGTYTLLDGAERPATTQDARVPAATDRITRTDLVQSKNLSGTVTYADRVAVKASVEGTVTRAAETGKNVGRGNRLYDLDARPVILLYGETPMFRDLKAGDVGPDVLQLRRNLQSLGFGPPTVLGPKFDKETEDAVKRWQKFLGHHRPDGKVARGDVVFLDGPGRIAAADAEKAEQVQPGKTVLTLSSDVPVVEMSVSAEDKKLVRPGTRIEVQLPSGTKAKGKVKRLVSPRGDDDADGGEAKAEIALNGRPKITDKDREPDQATVTIITERSDNALSVPVDAIVALREGGYGLEIVEGGRIARTVKVETGVTADGRIEVKGTGLQEGMKVGVAGR